MRVTRKWISQPHVWMTALLAVLVVYTLLRFGLLAVRPPGFIPNDYVNFHRGSERLIGNEAIYRPQDASPYKYSPTYLMLFNATFHQLPRAVAWFMWCVLSL